MSVAKRRLLCIFDTATRSSRPNQCPISRRLLSDSPHFLAFGQRSSNLSLSLPSFLSSFLSFFLSLSLSLSHSSSSLSERQGAEKWSCSLGFIASIFPWVAGSVFIPFDPVYYGDYNVVDGDDRRWIYNEEAARVTTTFHNRFFIPALSYLQPAIYALASNQTHDSDFMNLYLFVSNIWKRGSCNRYFSIV